VKHIKHCLLTLLFLLASVSSAAAQCTVNVIPVSFGAFDNLINPLYANGQVRVQCTPLAASVTIQLDAGSHANGMFIRRKLSTVAGQTLKYNLFTDPTYVLIWGDGTGTSSVVTGVAGIRPLVVNIYGRIKGGQTGYVGSYSDSITVSVLW